MAIVMDYKELLEKCNLLLGEVNRLTEENSQLKAQLGLTKSESSQNNVSALKPEINYSDDESIDCFLLLSDLPHPTRDYIFRVVPYNP